MSSPSSPTAGGLDHTPRTRSFSGHLAQQTLSFRRAFSGERFLFKRKRGGARRTCVCEGGWDGEMSIIGRVVTGSHLPPLSLHLPPPPAGKPGWLGHSSRMDGGCWQIWQILMTFLPQRPQTISGATLDMHVTRECHLLSIQNWALENPDLGHREKSLHFQ